MAAAEGAEASLSSSTTSFSAAITSATPTDAGRGRLERGAPEAEAAPVATAAENRVDSESGFYFENYLKLQREELCTHDAQQPFEYPQN